MALRVCVNYPLTTPLSETENPGMVNKAVHPSYARLLEVAAQSTIYPSFFTKRNNKHQCLVRIRENARSISFNKLLTPC